MLFKKNRSRNSTSFFLCLFALLGVAASCNNSPGRPADRLVIGIETGPSVLDPRFATDAVSSHICRLIYSGILKRNKNSELVPDLAEKVEQPDPQTYIITLKKGVFFHNGDQLSSKDVLFTFQTIMDPEQSSPKRSALEKIQSLRSPDAHTLIITLKEPFSPFLGNLTLGIVPDSSTDLAKYPVGSGPFSFNQYQKDEKLSLQAFPRYFAGKPLISGVDFRVIPDETVRILELKKGSIDMVTNPITPALLPWLKKQKKIRVETSPGTNASYIGFNLRDPVLKNKKVRLALAHAIDRKSIITHLLKGLAVESTSILSPKNTFFNTATSQVSFNPELAEKLLDEAGYPKPEGSAPRLVLTYKTSKNPTRRKIAEIFAQQFKKIGVTIEILSTEWGTFYSDIKSGRFQVYSLTWVGIADPDIYHYIFHSENIPPVGANRGHFLNEEVDDLLVAGRKEVNTQKRKDIYNKVQEILAAELPYINLWISVNVAAMRERVQNFVIYPDDSFDSISRVKLTKIEK
ncbi:MAG: ABC transporter substrate-binding protein [Nitrospinota bacterium]